MTEYERIRLEYILNKENELNNKEKNIKVVTECAEKNDNYQQAIRNINTIIDKLNLPPESICRKYNDINNNKIENEIKLKTEVIDKIKNLEIYHEVPIEYTESENKN